jgi:hypothetical protein
MYTRGYFLIHLEFGLAYITAGCATLKMHLLFCPITVAYHYFKCDMEKLLARIVEVLNVSPNSGELVFIIYLKPDVEHQNHVHVPYSCSLTFQEFF